MCDASPKSKMDATRTRISEAACVDTCEHELAAKVWIGVLAFNDNLALTALQRLSSLLPSRCSNGGENGSSSFDGGLLYTENWS